MPDLDTPAPAPYLPETDEHIARQRDNTRRINDLCAWHDTDMWGSEASEAEEKALASVAHMLDLSPTYTASDLIHDVLAQFLRVAPAFNLINVAHEPGTAEFHWSWVRCVLAAGGYKAHAALARIASDRYPLCPLSPDETHEQWTTLLNEAHRVSGWPATWAFVSWQRVRGGESEGEDFQSRHRVLSLLHILKYTRYDGRMVIAYRGRAAYFILNKLTNHLGQQSVKKQMLAALGMPVKPPGKKAEVRPTPYDMALSVILSGMTTNMFLPRKPLDMLPGLVFSGPWASVEPDATDQHGFAPTGLRLTGVWVAKDGIVSPYHGDESDVLGWMWNLDPVDYLLEARARFASTLPKTYHLGSYPSDILIEAFGNLQESWIPAPVRLAQRCLIDSVVLASLLRSQIEALRREYPIMLVMPASPTLEDSTNQGKTLCAHTIARSLVPSVPVSIAHSTGSAPDNRDLATSINTYGTACFDEWSPPNSKENLLANGKLQTLCTGGTVVVGRAVENTGGMTLRHSLVMSAKAVDFPADMLNRSLPIWLEALSRAQREDGAMAARLQSGQVSIDMRLSAVALAAAHDWRGIIEADTAGTAGWRFPAHHAIARHLWKLRTGGDETLQIGDMIAHMEARMGLHSRDAETSGLMHQLREGSTVNVYPEALFGDMLDMDVERLRQDAESQGRSINGKLWFSCRQLLRARTDQLGGVGRSVGTLVSILAGSRYSVSERTVIVAAHSKLIRLPESWRIPHTSWNLLRCCENDRFFFRLERESNTSTNSENPACATSTST